MSSMRGCAAAVGIAVAVAAGLSHGAVVYDAITNNTRRSTLFTTDEYAQDLTLSTGAGTAIRLVEVGVSRNVAFPGVYTGVMTVRLWADAGGSPGALLGVATAPVTREENLLVHIFAADFGPNGVEAPMGQVWAGVQFSYTNPLGAGLVYGRRQPEIGQWGRHDARRYPDGTWVLHTDRSDPAYIRITTVPAPGTLPAWLALLAVTAVRRRSV